jgi:hypothetical protein
VFNSLEFVSSHVCHEPSILCLISFPYNTSIYVRVIIAHNSHHHFTVCSPFIITLQYVNVFPPLAISTAVRKFKSPVYDSAFSAHYSSSLFRCVSSVRHNSSVFACIFSVQDCCSVFAYFPPVITLLVFETFLLIINSTILDCILLSSDCSVLDLCYCLS